MVYLFIHCNPVDILKIGNLIITWAPSNKGTTKREPKTPRQAILLIHYK